MIDKTEQTSDYNVQSFSLHVLLNIFASFHSYCQKCQWKRGIYYGSCISECEFSVTGNECVFNSPARKAMDLGENCEKMVKISFSKVIQGTGLEAMTNGQMKQIITKTACARGQVCTPSPASASRRRGE